MPKASTNYPTDLSDAQWNLLQPLLPGPSPTGRPRTCDLAPNPQRYFLRPPSRRGLAPVAPGLRSLIHGLRLFPAVVPSRRLGPEQHRPAGVGASAGRSPGPAQRRHPRQAERQNIRSGVCQQHRCAQADRRRQAPHSGGHFGVAAGRGRHGGQRAGSRRGQDAVGPLRPGVDPPGACVGRRGLCWSLGGLAAKSPTRAR